MTTHLTLGERIGNTRLSFIEEASRTHPERRRCKFVCDCSNVIEADLNFVRFGNISSCGCLKTEKLVEKNTKHGNAARNNVSGAYRSWQALHQRSGTVKNYEHVEVDERWSGENGFSNFLSDMGERSQGLSIEREDNSKGYEPNNCRWATTAEQNRNKSSNVNVTIDGVTKCIVDWCAEKNINRGTFKSRRKRGLSLEDAITTPVDTAKRNHRFDKKENVDAQSN